MCGKYKFELIDRRKTTLTPSVKKETVIKLTKPITWWAEIFPANDKFEALIAPSTVIEPKR